MEFLTKEDLMKFTRERLTEMVLDLIKENEDLKTRLAENSNHITYPWYPPASPYISESAPKLFDFWYQKYQSGPCFGGGQCTNPHHDCINCPSPYGSGGTFTTTGTNSDMQQFKDN